MIYSIDWYYVMLIWRFVSIYFQNFYQKPQVTQIWISYFIQEASGVNIQWIQEHLVAQLIGLVERKHQLRVLADSQSDRMLIEFDQVWNLVQNGVVLRNQNLLNSYLEKKIVKYFEN